MGPHRRRRQDHDPQRRRRNGPRLDDLAAAHRRRGDGRRLVKGRNRMDAGRRQGLRLQGSVRHRAIDVDRRQPRGAALFHAAAHGRRPSAQGVLIANAAQKWGVDAATLKTEPSIVINPANGARFTYGEIAAFGTIPATLPAIDPKELKERTDFRLIGKSVPRRDTPSKVNGTAQYAIDVKL